MDETKQFNLDGGLVRPEKPKNDFLIGQIVALMFIALLTGILIGWFIWEQPNTNTFNQTDKNFLIDLAYQTGTCERVGLYTSIIPQINNDTNQVFGLPVCVMK